MKRKNLIIIGILCGLTLAALSLNTAVASDPAKSSWSDQAGLDIWNDPDFKKQFVAYYGVNSEVEPRISPEEVVILEKIQPLMAEDLPKAEATLKKQVNKECSAILDFTLGGIYFQQDKMADALASYLTAVQKFPGFRRAWRNLGLIYVRDGKYDDAISAFTRMIKLGGSDPYSYGLLGFAYAAKQDYQAAEAAYRNALLLQPENTEWRLGITRCVFKEQKYEDAITLLEGLIERYPDKADFWLLQAQSYLGLKQPLKAAANIEAVYHLGKATLDNLYALGDIYVNESLMDLAQGAYMRAIDMDANQPYSRPLQSAELLGACGAFTQARQVAAHMRKTWEAKMAEGDRRELLKLEARLSMAEGGGSPETAGILEEVVKLNPLDGEALILLGQHYAKQNQPDRAIFYYERAASIEAFEANAKIRQAQVLVGLRRYAEAIPLLRRAQEIKPNDDVARYLEQVESVAQSRQ